MSVAPELMQPADERPARDPADVPPGSYIPGELIGGPLGRHARRGVISAMALVMIATIVTCLVGYGQKFPCRDVGNWTHNYQYTRVCYSDILPLYSSEKLDQGKLPYLDHPVEYPLVIGGAMELGAVVAKAAPKGDYTARNAVFFDGTVILLTLAAMVTAFCTALSAGRRRLDAVLFAAAPLLAFHAFTNWDLLAVAFAAGGILAWSKRAPVLAGILFGLGTATKAYPLLIVLAIGLLAYRAGRMRAWAKCAAWAVALPVALYASVWPFAGTYVDDAGHRHNNLWRFFELNQKRPADWDSVGYVLQYLGRTVSSGKLTLSAVIVAVLLVAAVGLWRRSGRAVAIAAAAAIVGVIITTQAASYTRRHGGLSDTVLNFGGFLAAVVLFVGVAYVVLTAPRRPRVPQAAFLVVVSFLLANKVDSPQYSLWLLPLAALAYPRWRPLLAWQLIEIFEVFMRYMWFIYDDQNAMGKAGVPEGWFVSSVVLRQLALVVLAALVIREIYRPVLDPVRRGGKDDPAGGILDGTPDRRAFV